MFTRQHYEALAELFRDSKDDLDRRDLVIFAQRLADKFANDNPRFDRARFMRESFSDSQ